MRTGTSLVRMSPLSSLSEPNVYAARRIYRRLGLVFGKVKVQG